MGVLDFVAGAAVWAKALAAQSMPTAMMSERRGDFMVFSFAMGFNP
jgi:hypothetical protein